MSSRYAYKGEMLTVEEISARSGLGISTVRMRIRNGFALDAPYGRRLKRLAFGEETLTIKEIAFRLGLHRKSVEDRCRRGKPLTHPRNFNRGGRALSIR